jgi:hypothetical protein
MTIAPKIDELQWINSYLGMPNPLDYAQMKPVLCFSLIWNLFETDACERNADPSSIWRSVDRANKSGMLSSNKYNQYVDYFRNRYYLADEKKFETFFDLLMLTCTKSREAVKRALNGDASDVNDIVYALLLIAHRIRNNFYHGNKDVQSLPQQIELFTAINSLLTTYLDDIQNLPSQNVGRQPSRLVNQSKPTNLPT